MAARANKKQNKKKVIKKVFHTILNWLLPDKKDNYTYVIRVALAVLVYLQSTIYGQTITSVIALAYIMACLYKVDSADI